MQPWTVEPSDATLEADAVGFAAENTQLTLRQLGTSVQLGPQWSATLLVALEGRIATSSIQRWLSRRLDAFDLSFLHTLQLDIADLPRVVPQVDIRFVLVQQVQTTGAGPHMETAVGRHVRRLFRPDRVMLSGGSAAFTPGFQRQLERRFSVSLAPLANFRAASQSSNLSITVALGFPRQRLIPHAFNPNDPITFDSFEFGQFSLTTTHQENIQRLAGFIARTWNFNVHWSRITPAFAIRAVGHTDLVGSERDNETLGQQRVEAVIARLRQELRNLSRTHPQLTGLNLPDPIGIQTRSDGERTPVVRTQDPEPRNRRVVIRLLIVPASRVLPQLIQMVTNEIPRSTLSQPMRTRVQCVLRNLSDPSAEDHFVRMIPSGNQPFRLDKHLTSWRSEMLKHAYRGWNPARPQVPWRQNAAKVLTETAEEIELTFDVIRILNQRAGLASAPMVRNAGWVRMMNWLRPRLPAQASVKSILNCL